MVDVEFIIDANDDTIAAASAAKIKPLRPTGMKFLINHGAALSFAIFPAVPKKSLVISRDNQAWCPCYNWN